MRQSIVDSPLATLDANEAVARIAYASNEVIAIYPITPASPMGEFADAWAAAGQTNIFGAVPQILEMQSEAGAAGAIHGALQGGALATTFTASQGLLLMIPNMFKIAGELTAAVIHVASRSVATHALSIFGDHSDVMAVRMTGFAMLASSSVQEAQDFALISQAATLHTRIPFLHFFDGFRTSHEINKIALLSLEDVRAMLNDAMIRAHRLRGLTPDAPQLRGTAQNPDVFFQAREAINPFYAATPQIVQSEMERLGARVGRHYRLFDYFGAADAERVLVMMGSGCGAAEEAVEALRAQGQPVGLLKVRLYRPFDVQAFSAALPRSVRSIAVLDRTKEPGAVGEPLYQDVVTAISESWAGDTESPGFAPRVIGGRYGLSSKEFTPSMAVSIFEHLNEVHRKQHFTVGIYDDVSGTSLPWNADAVVEPPDVLRAVFYGLGSDGTVGANKSSVKMIGELTNLYAQGYFVYDSKKSGSRTVSHLRFSPRPIRSTYLIRQATFVACHQYDFVHCLDVLQIACSGATFLLNSPHSAMAVWGQLPVEMQQQILDKQLRMFVVDADTIARETGLGGRINTVMQTCFFALAQLIPGVEAAAHIKRSIEESYAHAGRRVVEQNFAAVDRARSALCEVTIPAAILGARHRAAMVSAEAPDFVQRILGRIMAGNGDQLPVSALPVDGSFPTGTAQFEKRNIAQQLPHWDPDLCIECGLCALVCPHAVLRIKRYDAKWLGEAPQDFAARRALPEGEGSTALTIGISAEDCTGCGVCADVCPAKSKSIARHRALDMVDKSECLSRERAEFKFFLELPEFPRDQLQTDQVKDSQLLLPLFEYSGACAGCGETPYLKLLSQLFGDRCVIANATGCSSIFGGNLPTTPWSKNAEGRGPAWSNSLFEDNAEFGLGLRLALDSKRTRAQTLLQQLASGLDANLVADLLHSPDQSEHELALQRERVERLRSKLCECTSAESQELSELADSLVKKSLWIVGGDGWAYDIGYGGLDHALASGRDINVLVLDTGVYSNTGGQASKSTPRAAVAKFAMNGRDVHRKDLGMMAAAYGNVYVAQIAIGANPAQAVRAFHEAESYRGPSLLLAYCQCIAHGIDMSTGMTHQRELVRSGFWPLYRYDPRHAHKGERPFHLDSHKPTLRFQEVAKREARFAMLVRADPARARTLIDLAQQDIDDTWHYYEQLAGVERDMPEVNAASSTRTSADADQGAT